MKLLTTNERLAMDSVLTYLRDVVAVAGEESGFAPEGVELIRRVLAERDEAVTDLLSLARLIRDSPGRHVTEQDFRLVVGDGPFVADLDAKTRDDGPEDSANMHDLDALGTGNPFRSGPEW